MVKQVWARKHLHRAVFVAALVAVPATAMAGISKGDILGTDEAAVAAALESQGYKIIEIESEDGLIEAEIMAEGLAMEIEVDAISGQVLEVEDD